MRKLTMVLCILISFNVLYAQQTNNSGLTIVAQQSADGKQYKTVSGRHVPYATTAEFLAYVVSTRRHVGEIAYIFNGAAIETWQFVGGIADVNFVKATGGGSGTALDTTTIYSRINQNTTALTTKQTNLISGINLASINGISLLNPQNIVIAGASSKPLYLDLTTNVGGTSIWNFDSSSTAKIITNGTTNIDITGTVTIGSTGVLAVTQSASGNDLFRYNGVAINIAKQANKTSLVGFLKIANSFIFSVDTTINSIAQTGGLDADAVALFAAASTNNSYKTAVNNAIVGLKGISLAAGGTAWSKSVMINGRAGSNLTQQSFNWRNPAQYNYVYNGTFTYNANGTQFNGTTNYVNTGITPSTAFTGTTSDIAIVNVVGGFTTEGIIFGGIETGTNTTNFFTASVTAPATTFDNALNSASIVAPTPSNLGRFISFYSTPTTINSYRNGTLLGTRTNTVTATFLTLPIFEGAASNNGGTPAYFAGVRLDVTQVINSKLTVAESQAIDAVWAAYQTALSR